MGAENALYGPLGPFEVLGYTDGLKVSTASLKPAHEPLEIIPMNDHVLMPQPLTAQVDVRHEAGQYTVTIYQSGELRVDQHYKDRHGRTGLREITPDGQNRRVRVRVLEEARRRLQNAADAIPLPYEEHIE